MTELTDKAHAVFTFNKKKTFPTQFAFFFPEQNYFSPL